MFDNKVDIGLFSRTNGRKLKKGGKVVTWKQKYNKKYGFPLTKSHSLRAISKKTGVSMKGLRAIYNKGVGARKTNPESVRSLDGKKRGGKSLKGKMSAEQWAMGRVYSAVMGGKASKVDAKELKMEKGGLTKGKSHDEGGIKMVVKSTGQRVELEGGEGVLNKKVMSDDKKYDFEGKDMTACEIASELNQQKGDGVAFECEDVEGKFEDGGSIKDFELGGFISTTPNSVQTKNSDFVFDELIISVLSGQGKDDDFIQQAKEFYLKFYEYIFYRQYGKFLEGKTREYKGKEYPYGRIEYIQLFISFAFSDITNSPVNLVKQFTIQSVYDKKTAKLNSSDDFLSKGNKRKIIKKIQEAFVYFYNEHDNLLSSSIIQVPRFSARVKSQRGKRARTYLSLHDFEFPLCISVGNNATLNCFGLNRIYNYDVTYENQPPIAYEVVSKFIERKDIGIEIEQFTSLEKAKEELQRLADDDTLRIRYDGRSGERDEFWTTFQNYWLGLGQLPPFTYDALGTPLLLTEVIFNTNKTSFIFNNSLFEDSKDDKTIVEVWLEKIYETYFAESSIIFNYIEDKNKEKLFGQTFIENDIDYFVNLFSTYALETASYSDFISKASEIRFVNVVDLEDISSKYNPRVQRNFVSYGIFQQGGTYFSEILYVSVPYILLFEGIIDEEERKKRQKIASISQKQKKIQQDNENIKLNQVGFNRLVDIDTQSSVFKDLEEDIKNEVSLFDFLDYPKDKLYINLLNDSIRNKIEKFGVSAFEDNTQLPLLLLEYYYNQARQSPVLALGEPCGLPTPNGAKSKLPLQTYFAVRSPFFKMFFGDWEIAYEIDNYRNVSRVIDDETKEPRIMYHGVRKFVEGFGSFANMGEGVKRPYGEFNPPNFPASYFGDNKQYVEFYGGNAVNMRKPSPDYEGFYYSVFLNIRNPIDLRPLGFKSTFKDFIDYLFVKYGVVYQKIASIPQLNSGEYKVWVFVRNHPDLIEEMKSAGFDGIIQEGDVPTYDKNGNIKGNQVDTEYLTFYSSQIESASVKNNLYLSIFDDIRFKKGGNVSI